MLPVKRALCFQDVLQAPGRSERASKILECEAEERRGGLVTGAPGPKWWGERRGSFAQEGQGRGLWKSRTGLGEECRASGGVWWREIVVVPA